MATMKVRLKRGMGVQRRYERGRTVRTKLIKQASSVLRRREDSILIEEGLDHGLMF